MVWLVSVLNKFVRYERLAVSGAQWLLTDTSESDLYTGWNHEVFGRHQVSVRFEQSVVVQECLRDAANVFAITVVCKRPD